MSESSTEKAPRCGHETASGPCIRPLNHPAGHMSQKVADTKRENAKAKRGVGSLTPEEMEAKEAERAAAAAARIEKAREQYAARLARLEEDAAAFGMKLVPMTAKEKAAQKAAETGEKAPEGNSASK